MHILCSYKTKSLKSFNITKWLNKLKQFVGNLPTNCLTVSGHFVGLALKGLRTILKTPIPGYFIISIQLLVTFLKRDSNKGVSL